MSTFNKITREEVLECLKLVEEPILKEDIVSLGLVREIGIEKNNVFIHLETSAEDAGLQAKLREVIIQAVKTAGATGCEVHFSGKPKCGVSASVVQPISGVKRVIAVASGKGGVGKSTTAVNLALALKQLGARVGIMDADIYGPNIPIMLGISPDKRPEGNAQEKMVPLEAHGVKAISIGFFANPEQPVIWPISR
jgi:ATP-binding protein involved in chromosome partitioning